MVVPPRVEGGERAALVVRRGCADQLFAARIRKRVDGAGEAKLRESLRLALARAETRTPEQPLSLSGTEASCLGGDQRKTLHWYHRALCGWS